MQGEITANGLIIGGMIGQRGAPGNGIASIEKTGESGLVDTYTITYTNGTTDTIQVTNGAKGDKGDKGDQGIQGIQGVKGDKGDKGDTGEQGMQGIQGERGEKGEQGERGERGYQGITGEKGDKGDKGDTGAKGDTGETGNGIEGIEKTSTTGNVDTYTITFTDGTTTTFDVTNGEDGDVQDVQLNGTSVVDNHVANITGLATQAELDLYKTIYNVLPKVTGNGESITLDNTGESILKLDTRGQCKQDSTTGKNLQQNYLSVGTGTKDGYTYIVNSDKSITINGTCNKTSYLKIAENYTLPAGTYTLSNHNEQAVANYAIFYDDNGNFARATTDTKTFDSEVTISPFIRVENGATLNNFTIYPMIESGSSMTDYEPYTNGASPNPDYPQDIHEVSGDNTIKVEGKNRFDRANASENKALAWSSGNNYNENQAIASDYIKVNTNEQYSINYWSAIFFYDKNKNYLGCLQTGGTTIEKSTGNTFKTFTIPNYNSIYYMRLSLRPSSENDNKDMTKENLMLNKGATLVNYEPYNGDTYELDLGVENLLNANASVYSFPATSATVTTIGTISLVANTKYYITYNVDVAQTSNTRNTPKLVYNGANYYQYSTANENLTAGRKVWEFTPTTSGTYTLDYWVQGSNVAITISDFMISTTKGSYTPYGQTPIKMRGIGTYEDYFVRNSGKNMFDISTITENQTIDMANGNVNVSTDDRNTSDYIMVEENTKYTCSTTMTRYAFYDSSKTFISSNTSGDTITTPNNAKYLRFSYDNSLSNIQLEKGTSVSTYEPYGTGQWCKYNAIGKVVFDGNTYMEKSTYNQNYTAFYYIQNDMMINKALYSNYFSQVPITTLTNAIGVGIAPHNTLTRIYIALETSTASSSDELKTWLGTHNTTVYYVLATPYLSLIEDETLISQLDKLEKALGKDGQTNISQINNDIPFKIYASALKVIE